MVRGIGLELIEEAVADASFWPRGAPGFFDQVIGNVHGVSFSIFHLARPQAASSAMVARLTAKTSDLSDRFGLD